MSLFGKRTKQSGYGRVRVGTVERLVFDDAAVNRLARADSHGHVRVHARALSTTRPTGSSAPAISRAPRQVSTTNPFQKDYAWGRAELVNYRTVAGHDLQGVLIYPANYDASKKYPMIVNPYELLSQTLHQFIVPTERSYYDADGVDVRTGTSCSSRTSCSAVATRASRCSRRCEPAVRSVTSRGLVDSTKVGLVGHSWGGYEATFVPDAHEHVRRGGCRRADHELPELRRRDSLDAGHRRVRSLGDGTGAHGRARSGRTWRRTCGIRPAAKVNELKTPMLMEFGDADGTVDWHQGIEFYNFARRAGRDDFVMLVYPGEDHGLRKKENQIDYHRRINQWFGHWLKGEPAPTWMTEGMTWLERKSVLDSGRSDCHLSSRATARDLCDVLWPDWLQ